MLSILALAWVVAQPAAAAPVKTEAPPVKTEAAPAKTEAAPAEAAPAEAEAAAPIKTEADARAALAKTVESLRGRTAGTILVAAAGPDAERVAHAAIAEAPPGRLKLARVGVMGDPAAEVDRALADGKLDCAVRLGPDPAGGFSLTTHGACATAPDAAAAGATETPATEAAPAVAAPDTTVLESTYRLVALERVPVAREGRVAWEVRDGRGKRFGAVELARVTGDAAAERRLVSETRRSKLVSFTLGGAGAALAVTGLVLLATRDSGAPAWEDFEPDASMYQSSDDYALAELQAEADYDIAQDQHEIAKEDRTWIAGFCVAAGAVSLGATPFASQGVKARGDDPSLFWDDKSADALLFVHNNAIRKNLGLAPLPDPNAPPPPPPPVPDEDEEEEDDDLDAEPDDDEGEGEGEGEGDVPAAPPPVEGPAPDDGPAFLVTPLLGPTFAGVSVRF